MKESPSMIEAVSSPVRIRRAYNLWSSFYGIVAAQLEHTPRVLALERGDIRPRDKVLEVAVGPGVTLVEIVKKVERTNIVYGIDTSPKMLQKARRAANAAGHTN